MSLGQHLLSTGHHSLPYSLLLVTFFMKLDFDGFWLLIFRQNLFAYTSNISLSISELPLLCANRDQTWQLYFWDFLAVSTPSCQHQLYLGLLSPWPLLLFLTPWVFHFSAEGRGYLPVPRSTRCPVTHLGFLPHRHQYPFLLIKCFCLPPKFICWSPHPSVTLLEEKPLEGNQV